MALTEEQRNPWRVIVAGCDYNLSSQDWEDLLTELDSHYTEAPSADEQKPDLRAICIADENAFMRVLADRIVGNSNPEEDSRLDVAYAIARHLNLNWPSAYEPPITPPASEQKPIAWATTNEDGGYSILLEPAENIVAQRWTGNSPEEAIDAAIASVKGGE